MLDAKMWIRRSTLFARVASGFLGALLLIALGGCDSLSFLGEGEENTQFRAEVDYETLQSGAVTVDQIDKGQYGDIVEGTRKVLRSDDAFSSFWTKLHADQRSVPERPEVNFEDQVVVAVVLGQRPSGGYGVQVGNVLADGRGEAFRVEYTEMVPGDECAVTGVLTSPFVLVTVDATGGTFTFDGSEEARSC